MSSRFKQSWFRLFLYAAALAVFLILIQWMQWRYVFVDNKLEIYAGIIALLFLGLGIWLAGKLMRPQKETIVIEKEIRVEVPTASSNNINAAAQAKLGISTREMEVLQLMADGLSNQEIAGQLFLSLNTIKTHCSRLFEKLDVKRRTQAIEKAKRLGLIV